MRAIYANNTREAASAGRTRLGKASQNEVPIGMEEVAGMISLRNATRLINRMLVTNSGSPTTERDPMLMMESIHFPSFNPARIPRNTARGTERINTRAASMRELFNLPVTQVLIFSPVAKDLPQSPFTKSANQEK